MIKDVVTFNAVSPVDKGMTIHSYTDDNNDTFKYDISFVNQQNETCTTTLCFQHGPIKEYGVNGITSESLLAVLINRLSIFQQSPYACHENGLALESLKAALEALNCRTRDRMSRGVEGKNQK